MGVEKDIGRAGLGKEKYVLKPNSKDLVKEKGALAHAKAFQNIYYDTVREAEEKKLPLTFHTQDRSTQSSDGSQQLQDSPGFHFTATPWPEMGFQFGGRDRRDSTSDPCQNMYEPNSHLGVAQCEDSKGREEHCTTDRGECKGRKFASVGPSVSGSDEPVVEFLDGTNPYSLQGESNGMLIRAEDASNTIDFHKSHVAAQSPCGLARDGNGYAATQPIYVARRRADEGEVEADRMELEGGCEDVVGLR